MISEKIDIFLDVGKELNFSTVAKKRYTTQPTISRQIGDLEAEWGMKLFVRSNKGLRLTPEGAVMLGCCRKMEQQMQSGFKMVRELKSSKRDRLRLGFLTDINAELYFMKQICEFAGEYATLDITLKHGSFGELRKGLHNDQLDIIFTYDFEIANIQDDVVVDYVMDCNPCLAISSMHPLYAKENLSVADFGEEIFFLPEESDSPGREKDLLYLLRANQIPEGRIRLMPNQESVLLQVRLGRGVALVESAASQIQDFKLRTIPLSKGEKYGKLALVAVWKKENLNPFISVFVNDWMKMQHMGEADSEA